MHELLEHLRRCGVTVHLVRPLPCSLEHPSTVVVFLEAALGQYAIARIHALRFPGVEEVTFSDRSRAVMYVARAPALAARTPSGRT